jgi:FMN reductase
LLEHALTRLRDRGYATSRIDLAELPASALLGRGRSSELDDAIASVMGASIIVASTPVYRATYSGLLKVFFDLLPPESFRTKIAVSIATGGGAAHQLVLDHGLRPLFASLGAVVASTGVYGTDAEFVDGIPRSALIDRLDRATVEATMLVAAFSPRPRSALGAAEPADTILAAPR